MADFIFELPSGSEPTPAVEVATGAIDHTTAALKRLVTQFRKPKMQAYIRALCKPMQRIEQAILDVIASRNLDNAEGEALNIIGRIVKQPPRDVTATTYKSLVGARIPANKSSGLGDQVLRVARLVLTDYASQPDVAAAGTMKLRLLNYGHASFVLVVENMDVPWDLAQLLAEEFLSKIVGAGIRGTLHFVVQQGAELDGYTSVFRRSSLAGGAAGVGGYGSVTTPDVGGALAAAID